MGAGLGEYDMAFARSEDVFIITYEPNGSPAYNYYIIAYIQDQQIKVINSIFDTIKEYDSLNEWMADFRPQDILGVNAGVIWEKDK